MEGQAPTSSSTSCHYRHLLVLIGSRIMDTQQNEPVDREDETSFTLNGKDYDIVYADYAIEHPQGRNHIERNMADSSGSPVLHFGVFFLYRSVFIELKEAEEPHTEHRFQVHFNSMPGSLTPDLPEDVMHDHLVSVAKSEVGSFLRGHTQRWEDSEYMPGWKVRIIDVRAT